MLIIECIHCKEKFLNKNENIAESSLVECQIMMSLIVDTHLYLNIHIFIQIHDDIHIHIYEDKTIDNYKK